MIHNVMFAVATLPNNHYLFGGLIEGVKNNVSTQIENVSKKVNY